MDKILKSVMDIGEQMLLSGTEIHRIEDSATRILTALGAARVDVFVITTNMIISITTPEGEVLTQTRRINGSGTDFDKLHKLNDLSRRICAGKIQACDIDKALSEITPSRVYPLWVEFICYAVIAGAFTMFFGGDLIMSLVSLVVGIIIRVVLLASEHTVKNRIFSKFIASFVATALAYSAYRFGLVLGLTR